jgi:hypothetical protein
MRLFEVVFVDGITRICFGDTAENVKAKYLRWGLPVVAVNEIIVC